MPNYRGHLLGGLIVYICVMLCIVNTKPSFITACEWLFFTLAGSLFPDIDVKSRGQKYFYYVVLLLFICLLYQEKYQALSCMSFIVITPMLVKHRGIFHQSWFVMLLSISAWAVMSALFPYVTYALFVNMIFFIIG